MRRLIRFSCRSEMLSGSIDDAPGGAGLLCVTGGSQVRSGPHRMLHQIALHAAAAGYPAFRYERRGLGDSDGVDPGYRDSGLDLAAAAIAFRREAPQVTKLVGFGLCDGATTLALHGAEAEVSGIVLANPWLVETEPDTLAPAAARSHYRDRFLSPRAWGDVLTGKVDILGAARSLFGAVAASEDRSLADEVAARLAPFAGKLTLVLAHGDGTAITAQDCWSGQAFAGLAGETVVKVASDSHTFARPGNLEPVFGAVVSLLRKVENAG